MKKKGLKSKQFKMSLYASIVILATFPLALNSILTQDSFDTSSEASFEEPVITCTISFPYVSPLSVPENGTVHLRLDAVENGGDTAADYEDIVKIDVNSTLGGTLFTQEYDNNAENITNLSESFLYTPDEQGIDVISGIVTTSLLNGEFNTTECLVLSPLAGNRITVLQANTAPVFTTTPESATPSNTLKTGDKYTYILKATDAENDPILYNASFTPGASWLNISVIKNGSAGELELRVQGIAGSPAGYLGNVFIHDGYTAHLSSQSWVMSVEQGENDSPKITITSPKEAITVKQGEKVEIEWTATDLNQIVSYDVFYATNAGDETTWVKLDTFTNKFDGYMWPTDTVNPGAYKVIVQATDNQEPAAVGTAISQSISITGTSDVTTPVDPTKPELPEKPEEPIDGPVIDTPQIIEISPNDGATLINPKPTISATLTTGTGASIIKDSIKFELDDTDYTTDLDIAMIAKNEYRFVFKPSDDLELGEHKVTIVFEDDQEREGSESWKFEIDGDEKDVISIFGFKIPKQTAVIFGIGLLVLLAALVVPWILYAAWKNGSDEEEQYTVYDMPPKNDGTSNDDNFTSPSFEPSVDSTSEDSTTTEAETTEKAYFDTGVGFNPVDSGETYAETDPVEVSQNTYVESAEPTVEPTTVEEKVIEQTLEPVQIIPKQAVDDQMVTEDAQVTTEEQNIEVETVTPVFTDTNIQTDITQDPTTTPVVEEVDEPQIEEIQKLATALEEYKESDPYAFLEETNTSDKTPVQQDGDQVNTNQDTGTTNA
jgi:hypothetical protein